MDLKRIEDLLQRYYNGDTTLEEEQQLKDFFSNTQVPEHLKADQVQFSFYTNSLNERSGRDIEKSLVNNTVPQSKIVPLYGYWRSARLATAGMAAAILIVIGAYFILKRDQDIQTTDRSNKKAELAYLQTKKALLMISCNLNKGDEHIAKISKLNKIENLITGKK